jgi:hypothetical protein
VRNVGGQQEHVSLPNGNVVDLSFLHDLEDDVALDLVVELLRGVDVEVLALVGTAHDHHHELLILPDELIADRRLQEVTVFVDPGIEGERCELRHDDHLQGE